MGFGGISIWQLLIILAILVLIFGTKKLRNLGGDLGSAVKGFKKAMSEDSDSASQEQKKISEEKAQDAQFTDASKPAEKESARSDDKKAGE